MRALIDVRHRPFRIRNARSVRIIHSPITVKPYVISTIIYTAVFRYTERKPKSAISVIAVTVLRFDFISGAEAARVPIIYPLVETTSAVFVRSTLERLRHTLYRLARCLRKNDHDRSRPFRPYGGDTSDAAIPASFK